MDLHFYAIFVIAIENFHCLDGLRDRVASTDQNTVDVKCKGKVVGNISVDTSGGDGTGQRGCGAGG